MSDPGLWAFALDFYDRKGVADACISLQDTHGADVDLILFALWCGARGRDLDVESLGEVEASVSAWRHAVIEPVRSARRALKPPPEPPFDVPAAKALHEQMLSLEIEAERLQLLAMEAIAPPPGATDPLLASRGNLIRVAAMVGVSPETHAVAHLLQAVR